MSFRGWFCVVYFKAMFKTFWLSVPMVLIGATLWVAGFPSGVPLTVVPLAGCGTLLVCSFIVAAIVPHGEREATLQLFDRMNEGSGGK